MKYREIFVQRKKKNKLETKSLRPTKKKEKRKKLNSQNYLHFI